MSGPWLASYIALWAVVLFQGAIIFMLLRQLGIIYLGTAQGVSRDGLAPGERAPEFTVPDLDGRPASLADFRGRQLVLIFGSPNCLPCRNLIPDLNVFAHERREALHVLFLSHGEAEATRRFASETGMQVPVAVHPDETLAEKYKVRATPFGFLIDAEGVVRAKGLANNRSHLEMLLRMAHDKHHTRDASRNGKHEAESVAEEARP